MELSTYEQNLEDVIINVICNWHKLSDKHLIIHFANSSSINSENIEVFGNVIGGIEAMTLMKRRFLKKKHFD